MTFNSRTSQDHKDTGNPNVLTFDCVRNGELEVIRKRRNAWLLKSSYPAVAASDTEKNISESASLQATLPTSSSTTAINKSSDAIRNTLVGIALSGGGVRSGAVSLGFLMEISRSGYLKFVDYLSTVSGGGYAGAVLTAESCRIQKEQSCPDAYDEGFVPLFSNHNQQHRGAPQSSHTAIKGLRSLVNRANYLMQNQGWMSRMVLGVCAMGTLSFSLVVCICSLLAFFFRSFYTPEIYDYLDALNFRDDLWVPMVPSIFFFFIWIFCWIASFIRHGGQAQGIAAKHVFFALITFIVLGFTLIATTGDVQADELLATLGISDATWQNWGSLGSWIKTGAITLIGASLLPYFAPSALLKSGKEQVDLKKRLVFTLARNGLLFGVPLLIFAVISRENLSNWNAQRNSRIETRDLLEVPEFFSPIDHPLEAISDYALFAHFQTLSLSGHQSPPDALLLSTAARFSTVFPKYTWIYASIYSRYLLSEMTNNSFQQKRELLRVWLADELWSSDVQKWHAQVFRADEDKIAANAGATSPSELDLGTQASEINQASRSERVLSMIASLIHRFTADTDTTDFRKIVESNRARRHCMRLILHDFNRKLIDPDFAKKILFLLDLMDLPEIPPGSLSGEEKQAFEDLLAIRTSAQTTKHVSEIREEIEQHKNFFEELRATVNANWASYLLRKHVSKEQCESAETKTLIEESERLLAANIPSMQPLFHLVQSDPVPRQEDQSANAANVANTENLKVAHEEIIECLIAGNRDILSAVFPGAIRPRRDTTIFSSIVHFKDQEERLSIAFWSFAVFLISALMFDLNTISWHGYYAQQLGSFWVKAGLGSRTSLSIADITSIEVGMPHHLLNACVNFPGEHQHGKHATQDENPDDFLLSSLYCGSDHSDVGYIQTRKSSYANLTLADAIALSGAAVSPWATRNRLVQVLLLILNFRTGLWLPNPRKVSDNETNGLLDRLDAKFFPPLRWLALRFLPHYKHNFHTRPAVDWSHLLITDGGHYENLGIEPLLKRRCPVIIALDASEDRDYQFEGLATLMDRMRCCEGIDFFQPGTKRRFCFPDALIPDKDGISKDRIVEIEVCYPGKNVQDQTGVIFYVKNTLLKKDPLELLKQRKINQEFPNDSTSDQFFSPDRFEIYRFLGVTSARDLCDLLDQRLSLYLEVPKDGCNQSQDLTLIDNEQFVKAVCYPNSDSNTSPTSSDSRTETQTPATNALPSSQIIDLLDTLAIELKELANNPDTDSVGKNLKQLIPQLEFVRRFASKITGACQWQPVGAIPASLATLAAADSNKRYRQDLLQLLINFLNISGLVVHDPEEIQSTLTKLSEINGISIRHKGLLDEAQRRIAEILTTSGHT